MTRAAARIVFRVDASLHIGIGHVMRCLTLADALQRQGAECHFICREMPEPQQALIRRRGHGLHDLSPRLLGGSAPLPGDWPRDAAQTNAVLQQLQPDWLVLDHYGLDAEWERAVRSNCGGILAIDDLANRPHACEMLLDQNFFADPGGRYAKLLPATSTTLFGPRYALLSNGFAGLRPRQVDRRPPPGRVLVFFGGGSLDRNLLAEVLRALDGYPALAVDIVARDACGDTSLQEWCAARQQAECHPLSDNFPERVAAADIAIGAGGSSTWERCCLGLPALVLGIAPNQYAVAEAVGEQGAHLYLGPAEQLAPGALPAALACLLASPALRQSLALKGWALVDGSGADRVAKLLMPPPKIAMHPATEADCRLVYDWRNDPATRRFSFNAEPIPWEVHAEWYARCLANPARPILIGTAGGSPIGVVRYDTDGEDAEVSIHLAPEQQGKGYGSALLEAGWQWLQAARPGIRRLHAHIQPSNPASRQAFQKAGFREHSCHYILDAGHTGI